MTNEPTAEDWAEAVRYVRGFYPEDIFPWPTETVDGKSAFVARLTCDNVVRRAQELAADRVTQ